MPAGSRLWPGFFSAAQNAAAQTKFYEGKSIRFIVGFSAGGGYDAYTRTIARHIGKHIPGNPAAVVDNMPGAGSLIAANNIFKAAKPDGLTVGHFIGGLFLQQLLGKPGIEFDSLKFEYIGVPAPGSFYSRRREIQRHDAIPKNGSHRSK